MQTQGFSPPMIARHELEEAWRLRVEEALQTYREATEEYRRVLREEPDGQPPDPESILARARQTESEALMEYSRLLRIFTDLTIHGKLPEETAAWPSAPIWSEGQTVIAVVDDDESIRDSTKKLLRSAGYQVATFASAELFLDSGALAGATCMVLDVRMPGMDGLELQRRLNASHAGVPVIFLTAHDDARSRRMAMEGGALDFLCKPFEANTLITAVQTALTRRALGKPGGTQR